jgi:predicted lipoprotein with Yx(FWY)xxD motif
MRRFMALMCVPAIIVGLAACGSSSSSKSAKTSSTTASTSSTSAGSATPVVKTATSATLGKIVVDASGKTVYTLTNNGQPVACTGQCLTIWPAVLLPSGTTKATGGDGVTGLGATAAAGGTQVTVDGKPVYTFSVDTSAGDTKGDGLNSFGGTWHAVKVSGSSSATTTTPTTTGSSSGY